MKKENKAEEVAMKVGLSKDGRKDTRTEGGK